MRRWSLLALAILVLQAHPVAEVLAASSPTPEMFAYGMRLEANGDQALYEVVLPLAVYQGVTRSDLGDIRIFNASGTVVPHALRQPLAKTERTANTSTPVPFFPITGRADQPLSDLSLQIKRNREGSIVDVNIARDSETKTGEKLLGYLVDATSLQTGIDSLQLSWADASSGFSSKILVEKSSDLLHWTVVTTGSITQLLHLGHRLDHNTIEFATTSAKYYRLTWPAGQGIPFTLTGITALSHADTVITQPQRLWFAPPASLAKKKKLTYLCDLKGNIPVQYVKIRLQDKNALAGVRLSSGKTPDKPEREHWRGLAYTLDINGESLSTPLIAVAPGSHRYWLLTVEEAENSLGLPPVIEFGWQPRRLVFMAQGDGPFLLAYGSTRVEPTHFQVNALLDRFRREKGKEISPRIITTGAQYALGSEKNLRPSLQSLPWRKYLLWTVLFAGVVFIGWMTRKLYKQMQTAGRIP